MIFPWNVQHAFKRSSGALVSLLMHTTIQQSRFKVYFVVQWKKKFTELNCFYKCMKLILLVYFSSGPSELLLVEHQGIFKCKGYCITLSASLGATSDKVVNIYQCPVSLDWFFFANLCYSILWILSELNHVSNI